MFIDPRKILTALSLLLTDNEDLEFCSIMVQTLSIILLTSTELKALRDRLCTFTYQSSAEAVETRDFFVTLYTASCHNSVATVTLCLLCELYEHATTLLRIIAASEMTVDSLCELDKLVQLVESPVFAPLRLKLLEVNA